MSAQPLIQIDTLTKRFGDVRALDEVSLEIGPGRIVGLLGANGGGKSTLLRHMVGLYLPDRGGCSTFGVKAEKLPPEELSRIGYVHQEGSLIDWMTAAQLIRYVAAYYPTAGRYLDTVTLYGTVYEYTPMHPMVFLFFAPMMPFLFLSQVAFPKQLVLATIVIAVVAGISYVGGAHKALEGSLSGFLLVQVLSWIPFVAYVHHYCFSRDLRLDGS